MPAGRSIEPILNSGAAAPVPGYNGQFLVADGQLLQTANLAPVSVLDGGAGSDTILRWFNNAGLFPKLDGEPPANTELDFLAHVGGYVEKYVTDLGQPSVHFRTAVPPSDGRTTIQNHQTTAGAGSFAFFTIARVATFPAVHANRYLGPSIFQEQGQNLGILYYTRAGQKYVAGYSFHGSENYAEFPTSEAAYHVYSFLARSDGLHFRADRAEIGVLPLSDVIGAWTLTMGNVDNGHADTDPPDHFIRGGWLVYPLELTDDQALQTENAILAGHWSS